MKLSFILENLTYGELKQLGVGGFEDGSVQPENYAEVVNHINLALQSLYARFPIREKEVLLEAQDDVVLYHLRSEFGQAVDPDDGYIVDTAEDPFADDILKITGVFDGEGYRLPLNDPFDTLSVFLPSYDTVQIPYAVAEANFAVIYRASATLIVVPEDPSDLDLEQEVYLPETLLEPLLVYVSYRVQKGQGGEIGLALSVATKQHYEGLVAEVKKENLLNSAKNVTNIKPELRGWV